MATEYNFIKDGRPLKCKINLGIYVISGLWLMPLYFVRFTLWKFKIMEMIKSCKFSSEMHRTVRQGQSKMIYA